MTYTSSRSKGLEEIISLLNYHAVEKSFGQQESITVPTGKSEFPEVSTENSSDTVEAIFDSMDITSKASSSVTDSPNSIRSRSLTDPLAEFPNTFLEMQTRPPPLSSPPGYSPRTFCDNTLSLSEPMTRATSNSHNYSASVLTAVHQMRYEYAVPPQTAVPHQYGRAANSSNYRAYPPAPPVYREEQYYRGGYQSSYGSSYAGVGFSKQRTNSLVPQEWLSPYLYSSN